MPSVCRRSTIDIQREQVRAAQGYQPEGLLASYAELGVPRVRLASLGCLRGGFVGQCRCAVTQPAQSMEKSKKLAPRYERLPLLFLEAKRNKQTAHSSGTGLRRREFARVLRTALATGRHVCYDAEAFQPPNEAPVLVEPFTPRHATQ